ncbi:hypothetical protein JHD46_00960 [Sulfurimonas sp. SAG-AH-194-C20]|nr:hypothetical protein [Sulfurimonas sp. SAG-AH-194-C20]MDF1878202.1 hypothetical protein [Sulfurimonas sp. SAG-AH-194-C20]
MKFYKIYHANLSFSAIEESAHMEVIEKTYLPLLNLIHENKVKIAIEMSGYTLERIQELKPIWIQQFSELHKKGLVELIGSGYIQMIAPMVPYEVNIKNQKLGLEVYKEILNLQPSIAYVNEQVFSRSLVDIYAEVGYSALATEWNNPYSIHASQWKKSYAFTPVLVKGYNSTISLLWTDSLLFQQFQRVVHQEIEIQQYELLIDKYHKLGYIALPLYSSDLEIFNYRPGRFETEALISTDEWERISFILQRLQKKATFYLPSEILASSLNKNVALLLTSAAFPIIVKKQTKYSLSRWSACGRGANQINTLCLNYYQNMKDDKSLKTLLQYWGSDYRTHITHTKWNNALKFLDVPKQSTFNEIQILENDISLKKQAGSLIFEKGGYKINFNLNKGLALDSIVKDNILLPFGTVHHGELDYIINTADFHTSTTIIESAELKRVSDLVAIKTYSFNKIAPNIYTLSTSIRMKNIALETKTWTIDIQNSTLSLDISLQLSDFVNGTIRAGTFTLLKQKKDQGLWYECKNGGDTYERFYFNDKQEINHSHAKSLIQSSNAGLGVTNGILRFGNTHKTLVQLTIDTKVSSPFVMLQNSYDSEYYLTRVFFSLQELDDTLKESPNRDFKLKYTFDI